MLGHVSDAAGPDALGAAKLILNLTLNVSVEATQAHIEFTVDDPNYCFKHGGTAVDELKCTDAPLGPSGWQNHTVWYKE